MVLQFDFNSALNYLIGLGVIDVLLPFILIFSIVFAILEKTHILGQEKHNINVIVALAIGLLVVVQRDIVEIINIFLPRVSLILIVVLMILMLIALVSGRAFPGFKDGLMGFAMVICVGAVILALVIPPGTYYGGFYITQYDLETLLGFALPLLLLFGAFWLVTKSSKKPEGNAGTPKDSFFKILANGLKDSNDRGGH